MDENRPLHLVARFELRQQAVDVVDVPRPLDLGDHHDLEPIADLADQLRQVVEAPRAVEAVDAGPQRRVAEIDLAADLDQPVARVELLVGRNRVFEIAEQDVGLLGHLGQLRRHLRIAGIEEVNAARRLDGDLVHRRRCADRQRLEKITRATHGPLLEQ